MKLQKRLASQILKCGPSRVTFDPEKLTEIKEAITKFDVKRLINKGIVKKVQAKGVSRARAKKRAIQKRKGRRAGHGSRKGKANARQNSKDKWIAIARTQRSLLKRLREKEIVTTSDYRILYMKVKGGFFRSLSHIKVFIDEKGMVKKK